MTIIMYLSAGITGLSARFVHVCKFVPMLQSFCLSKVTNREPQSATLSTHIQPPEPSTARFRPRRPRHHVGVIGTRASGLGQYSDLHEDEYQLCDIWKRN